MDALTSSLTYHSPDRAAINRPKEVAGPVHLVVRMQVTYQALELYSR